MKDQHLWELVPGSLQACLFLSGKYTCRSYCFLFLWCGSLCLLVIAIAYSPLELELWFLSAWVEVFFHHAAYDGNITLNSWLREIMSSWTDYVTLDRLYSCDREDVFFSY